MNLPDWLEKLIVYVSSSVKPDLSSSGEDEYEYDSVSSSPPSTRIGDIVDTVNSYSANGKGQGKGGGGSKRSSKGSSSSKKKGKGMSKSKSSKSSKGELATVPPSTPAPQVAPSTPEPTNSQPREPDESETPIVQPTLAPLAPAVQPTLTPVVQPTSPVIPPTLAPNPSPNLSVFPTPSPTSSPVQQQPETVTPATPAPTTPAPPSLLRRVAIPPYFIAYAAPLADREPTVDEYLLVGQLTTLYFEEILGAMYNNADPDFGVISSTTFDSVESVINETRYNAGIPEEQFNLYISFETDIVFSNDSSIIPNAMELYDIMVEAINPTYIVNYVWQAPESPFISTQEVLMNVTGTPVNRVGELDESPLGPGAGSFGQGHAGDAEQAQHSFGSGTAIDRGFSESPLREHFVLPYSSVITTKIFREDKNVTDSGAVRRA